MSFLPSVFFTVDDTGSTDPSKPSSGFGNSHKFSFINTSPATCQAIDCGKETPEVCSVSSKKDLTTTTTTCEGGDCDVSLCAEGADCETTCTFGRRGVDKCEFTVCQFNKCVTKDCDPGVCEDATLVPNKESCCSTDTDTTTEVKYIPDAKPFHDAVAYCEEINGNLLSLDTEEKFHAVADYVDKEEIATVWIYGKRVVGNQFAWGNKKSIPHSGPGTYWGKYPAKQPDGLSAGHDCLALSLVNENDGHKWNDLMCTDTYTFFCEVDHV